MPPASSISPFRSCHRYASCSMPPCTRPVLSAFAMIVGERDRDAEQHAAAAMARRAPPAGRRAGARPARTPWSTRTAPTRRARDTAAVVTIR